MTRDELFSKWTNLAQVYTEERSYQPAGELCSRFVADLQAVGEAEGSRLVTYLEAARITGYHPGSIERMVRDGRLTNYGRKHAPRVRVAELPKRVTTRVAATRRASYDPVADAQSLRRRVTGDRYVA